MHLVNEFLFKPHTFWLVDEDQVLVPIVDHACRIVHVHVLDENQQVQHVGSVFRTNNCTFYGVLQIHVVVIVTVAHFLQAPATTILELFGDGPPIKVFFNPIQRWHTVSCVSFKEIEERCETKSASRHYFPEPNPFEKSWVFIDHLSLCETQGWIRVHRGRLHERLELVTRMRRCALDAKNPFNWLFHQFRVAQSGRNMGELLILTPLNLILGTLIMVIVGSCWTVLKCLLEILLNLKQLAGWLSPSVVVLPERVLHFLTITSQIPTQVINLQKPLRNVGKFFQVVRSDLSNVEIN